MNPLIRGLFNTFKESHELEGMAESDAFELFAASLTLSDDALSQTELSNFLLDEGTPGLDVVVIEVNGQIVRDASEVDQIAGEASRVEVSVVTVQAKESPKTDIAQILNSGSTLEEFLNGDEPQGYPILGALARAFQRTFHYASKFKTEPSVTHYFVSTADKKSTADDKVVRKKNTLRARLSELGFIGEVRVEVWGTEDLYSSWSRRNNSNEVEISLEKQINLPGMPGIDQAILGAVSVGELLKMVTDEKGQLDERVFYENVRGFQGGENPVNEAMLETMAGDNRSLLMVLNNGVTVVAESYSPKPGDSISLSGYQIVNGCQTTNCIYLSRDLLEEVLGSTYVPMKVVVTSDNDIATQIIRATNSQTAVRESDFVSLSDFQKQLEEFYRLDDANVNLTYERRAGQFYGKDVIKTRVVNVNDQLRSIAAVALGVPHSAARYPSRLYDQVKQNVFQPGNQLLPYVAAAYASYRLENAFRTGLESKYKSARYHILTAFSYQVLGKSFADLDKKGAEADAKKIIESLRGGDSMSLFRSAADAVAAAAGGEVPTRDRLKGSPFTQDLLRYLNMAKSLNA